MRGKNRLPGLAIGVFLAAAVLTIGCASGRGVPPLGPASTNVSIQSNQFLVNGSVTYPARPVAGMLLNFRAANAIFDDENPITRSRWNYPDTGSWDADRNTSEFVAAMPSYAQAGLKNFTVSFQGGRPTSDPTFPFTEYIATGFNPDGSLKPAWLSRLSKVLTTADSQGMVVTVTYFYVAQASRLSSEAAVLAATDNLTAWLVDNHHANVIVDVANETSDSYPYTILQPTRISELITRIKEDSNGQLKVSASVPSGGIPNQAMRLASDFFLLHGNGLTPSGIASQIAQLKATAEYQAAPRPIIYNEDSTSISNMDTAISNGASWGYHDKGLNNYHDGFQSPPINWTINTQTKLDFFNRVSFYAGP